MKLVDILARTLKAWPVDGCSIHQGYAGNLFTVQNGCLGMIVEKADDWLPAQVTSAEWQAAVDALKVPKVVEWNGEGLPPVGVPVEMKYKAATADWARPDFHSVVLAWVGNELFVTDDEKVGSLCDVLFRPIRTPEQIAAEDRTRAIEDMVKALGMDNAGTAEYIRCGLIYDAGYRKQVAS